MAPFTVSAMADPTILHADEACAVGTLANVSAAIWRGECTVARNEKWVRSAHDLARRLGTPIVVMSIVTVGAPTPPSAIRTAQSRFLEELSRTALAAGAIVDGTGFRASLVRAVVSSVTTLARYKCPFHVAASDADMAQWIQERSVSLPAGAPRASALELRGLFAALRAKIDL